MDTLPAGLNGDQRYAYMSKKMGMFLKEDGEASTWQSRLKILCGWHNGFKSCKKNGLLLVAHATRDERKHRLFQCFKMLWSMGYRIKDPANLQARHVDALVAKLVEDGFATSTIQNRISDLRTMCGWLGKRGVVRETAEYANEMNNLKRTGIAERDKSWTGNGIDAKALIEAAIDADPVVAMQLVLIGSFGLRTREALMFDIRDALRKGHLWLSAGPKGGLGRAVPIETDDQRRVLDFVKAYAATRPNVRHLGWADRNLEQAINRTYYIFRTIGLTKANTGVTCHGLRHEYCHDLMIRRGLIPAFKGGSADQMSKDDRDASARSR